MTATPGAGVVNDYLILQYARFIFGLCLRAASPRLGLSKNGKPCIGLIVVCVRLPVSSSYASPIEFVWTMWTIFHKSPQQQQKQARIFPANF
jgi:hypothetical protein